MIWYGGALSLSDTSISIISNQTDIASTLLPQLGIDSRNFVFGKNIFAQQLSNKTLYMFNNGFGYLSDSLVFYYERDPNKYLVVKGKMDSTALRKSKAYLQMLYEDLLDR